jgi:uncharacterized protein involved in exopolysaccharide biosynthesis
MRLLAVVLRERRVVIITVALGVVISVGMALMRQLMFTSNFSFVPQVQQDAARSGLAGIAGQFGVSLGTSGMGQTPQLYADLLKTREILVPIAKDSFTDGSGARVPLAIMLGYDPADPAVIEKLLRELGGSVITSSVATRTTGTISVSVRTPSARASMEIANRLIAGVNAFNLVTRQSQAREERRFAGERLEAARASLRAAEDAMTQFLASNRSFSTSPQLTFERDRLQREVTLQQTVLAGLSQNYEDARIREVRDTPVITVIDRPVVAVLPDARGRLRLLAMGTMLAFIVGSAAALGRDWLRSRAVVGQDPDFDLLRQEWRRWRGAGRA